MLRYKNKKSKKQVSLKKGLDNDVKIEYTMFDQDGDEYSQPIFTTMDSIDSDIKRYEVDIKHLQDELKILKELKSDIEKLK